MPNMGSRAALLALLLSGCQAAAIDHTLVSAFPSPPGDAARILPAIERHNAPAVGSAFAMLETSAGKTAVRTESVAGAEVFSGRPALVLISGGGRRVVRVDNGNTMAEADEAAGELRSYTPEPPWLRFPMRPGDSWSAPVTETVVSGAATTKRDFTATVTAIGYDEVIVPAGAFRAMKLRMTPVATTSAPAARLPEAATYWYVADLGVIVRIVFDNGDTRQLLSIVRPDV